MGPEGTAPRVHARHACNRMHPEQDTLEDGAYLGTVVARLFHCRTPPKRKVFYEGRLSQRFKLAVQTKEQRVR